MKLFLFFSLFSFSLFAKTCKRDVILGPFPVIHGMTCDHYALMISFVSIVSAALFWSLITK